MNEKQKKIDWLRLVSTTLLVCAITFALFYLHSGKIFDVIEQLESEVVNKEPKYPNAVWLFKFLSNIIPIVFAVIVVNLMYSEKAQAYVPIYTQLEKLIVFSVLAVFIYGGLLTYTLYRSQGGSVTDPETGELIMTLWDKSYVWFFTQMLPLFIVISYHIVRIRAEKKELTDAIEISEETESDGETEAEETV